MKRLFMICLLLLPFTVTAMDFKTTWFEYPYPDATITSNCIIVGKADVVTVSDKAVTKESFFSLPASYGDTIHCELTATYGDKTSDAEVAQVTIPFPSLPAPTGVTVIIVPAAP